jgi:cytochrome P450 PksS
MGLFSFSTEKGRSPVHDPFNIASPEFKANPYPFYARLRAEAPVHRVTLPTGEIAWLITRYDDVAMVLRDERFVKDTLNALTSEQIAKQPWFRKVFKSLKRNMLGLDPPDHPRLRALVHKVFTPRLIEQMRGRVQGLTDELLDKVQDRGRMDLIRDYALPIPTTIIAEMLGVPAGDRHEFHRWSNAIMSAAASTRGLLKAIPNAWALMRYIRKTIKKRRSNPRDDLMSALVRAEEAGDTLSEDELLAMVLLLLVAGHETTVNLIGNGTLALLEHPDQMERLRNDPALIKPALEELLRYASPVEMATERYAREDVTIAGATIPRGEMVLAVLASANRDERQFTSPDSLDITREPNRHLSFGLGAHFCLGAALARLEGQIAISTLLRRVPDLWLTVAPDRLRWRRGLLLRGLESLPVAFGRHAAQGEGQCVAEAGVRKKDFPDSCDRQGDSCSLPV